MMRGVMILAGVALLIGGLIWMWDEPSVVPLAPPEGGEPHADAETVRPFEPSTSLPNLPESRVRVTRNWLLEQIAPNYVDPAVEGLADDAPTLSGRVAWLDDGSSVPGASVELTSALLDTVVPTESPPDRMEPIRIATVTDRFGKFELSPVPNDRALFLRIAYGRHCVEVRKVAHLPGPGERTELGTVTIERRGSIAGRIRGQGGARFRVRAVDDHFFRRKPLRDELTASRLRDVERMFLGGVLGSELVEGDLRARDHALPFADTMTDSRGAFVLHGVRPGLVELVVQATRPRVVAARRTVRVVAGRQTELGEWTVEPMPTTRVALSLTDGGPIVGADVTMQHAMDGVGPPPVRTDADGIARVAFVPGGTCWVRWKRRPDLPWERRRVSSAAEIEIQMRPLQTVEVQVGSLRGDDLVAADVEVVGVEPHRRRRFEHLEANRWVMRDVPPGMPVTVVVGALGHMPHVCVVHGGKSTGIRLRPQRAIRVEVSDPGGAPVAGAHVFAAFVEPERWAPRHAMHGTRFSIGETDESGAVVFDDLAMESIELSASHPQIGRGRVARRGDRSVARIVLRKPGGVAGGVTRDNRVESDSRWAVALARFDPEFEQRITRFSVSTLATDDGQFEFPDVDPGSYWLVALEPGVPVSTRPARSLADEPRGIVARKLVAVEAGATAFVDLAVDRDDGALLARGRVLVNGVPGLGLEVRGVVSIERRTFSTRSVFVDVNGEFAIDVKPFRHETFAIEVRSRAAGDNVVLARREFGRRRATIELDCEFELATGSIASALYDDGRALSGREVAFRPVDPSNPTNPTLVTDPQGYVRAERLIAGDYVLIVDGVRGGALEFGPIEIRAGEVLQRDLNGMPTTR